MTEDQILVRMQDTFAEILEISKDKVTLFLGKDDVENWDSFVTISMISAIENELEISLDLEAAMSARTVGALLAIACGKPSP